VKITPERAASERDFNIYSFMMKLLNALLLSLVPTFFIATSTAGADPVRVRYPEGSVHGYLSLRSLDGKLLAAGDLTQTVQHGRLTSRLIYRFRDGSIDDDTAVFTQNGTFRLVSDHRIQKGPIFPKPTELTIKAQTGEITVRYTENGKEKVETTHMDLPDDLSNGILLDVVKNIPAEAEETKISYVAATPKPRLIKLSLKSDGTESFRSAGRVNYAHRFVIHADLGGIMGLIAPMLGKAPADSYAWVSGDEVPAFIRSESPLYLGGPVLRTELVSPVWNRNVPDPATRPGK
jgi:hypothetical protein